jgi:DNA processing protein
LSNKLFQLALSLAPRVGDMYTKQLISYLGSAEEVLKTPKAKLLKIPGVGDKIATGLSDSALLDKAEKILTDCQKNGVEILHFTDSSYPDRLKMLDDSPCILYKKGTADLNFKKGVAIVGTREATKYGAKMCDELLENLKSIDCTMVSGLAYGIDIIAHKKCLEIGLPTIGVMANGIDSVYPADHRIIAQKMQETGAVLTENPPGSRPDAPKFPARNRIIAGMTDVTIVVEAAAKGGALITAEIANSYNKEIFAFPGNLDATYSAGCNQLIKNHKAHIYTSFDDLTSIMNWGQFEARKKPKAQELNLSGKQLQIYELLHKTNKSATIDEISRLTQISILELLPILLEMEFANVLRSIPGNEYEIR